jgi:DNA repair exonuclease SbcCD ATPase subunit
MNRINESDLQNLFDQVFQSDDILSPPCSTEYAECPYYRLSDTIHKIKENTGNEVYDSETLRGIQIISNNIDNILNELDRMDNIRVPDSVKEILKEKSILSRLENKFPFFDTMGLQEYLSILKEYEIYTENKSRLVELEQQLVLYKKSGVESQLAEIKELNDNIEFYRNNITTLSADISLITKELSDVDNSIGLLSKYSDSKKYRAMFESTLESTKKILIPLENAASEKVELDYQMREISNDISRTREEYKSLENKITEYKKLVKEGEELSKKHKDLTYIQEAVSTKKGIPVIYMKKYLGKIQKMANNLLKLIYDGDIQLGKFKVDNETFEVPYIKNGTKIADVKYASQSELSSMTMALSFALANNATGKYNILLLDETDAGYDEANRSAFLKMLYMQMNTLHAEQVFIISHNLTQMINIPMDIIKTSDIDIKSKLQNVIYE